MNTRREFISMIAASTAVAATTRQFTFAAATQPSSALSSGGGDGGAGSGVVRAGVITDLHHLLFGKDHLFRLKAFIDESITTKADFVLQCGDFCYPAGWSSLQADWERFPRPRYHVLGNHDMDKCDKQTIMKLWGMPQRYYSFDNGGFHFVVMDRNNFIADDKSIVDYDKGNYYKAGGAKQNYADDAQLKWLEQDLSATDKPTVVWVHQPILSTNFPGDAGNTKEILQVFDHANYEAQEKTGKPRVIAAFMGHDHADIYTERNGVHYILLNSASYAYTSAGASFYKDPLYAFVTFDPAGKITIEGRSTVYSSEKTPESVRAMIPPKISSRSLPVA